MKRVAGLGGLVALAVGCAGERPTLGGGPGPTTTTATTAASGRGEAGAPSTSAASGDPEVLARPDGLAPIRFGVAVSGASPGRLDAIERQAGATVGIVRVFTRWDSDFPGPNHQVFLDDGRIVHLSVRPRTDGGQVIPWSTIASAEPGSAVHAQLVEWIDTIAPYGSQLYFTFNHEPETADSAANGTAEDYVAAWRRVVELLRERGGEGVRTVFVMTRGAYVSGAADTWYPGDDVVDVVGADPYNWHRCQGTDRPWRSPSDLIEPALSFAIERGKPLALPEIASTEDPDDPQRKSAWIVELAETLATPPVSDHLEFASWFSVDDRSWPDCQWRYDSSEPSARAFTSVVAWFG